MRVSGGVFLFWATFLAPAAQAQAPLKVSVCEATFLIDKKGHIAATYIGLVDQDGVEANLKKLMGER